MKIIKTKSEMQEIALTLKRKGESMALVPTKRLRPRIPDDCRNRTVSSMRRAFRKNGIACASGWVPAMKSD
jgi:hypothetical protein